LEQDLGNKDEIENIPDSSVTSVATLRAASDSDQLPVSSNQSIADETVREETAKEQKTELNRSEHIL